MVRNHLNILNEDQPGIIPVKFGQNPIRWFRRCRLKKLFMDAHTTDKMWSQKLTFSLYDRWAKTIEVSSFLARQASFGK